ncbi:hypothetical protein CDAR_450861 [Caerostris darwini]|uniref:Uncharacterized protein n=1 Tax=Caerostris darwini TaxID=1538125 RepID=A0AAV4PKZ9_9ARAC|nr:hypothetical protein CDAR_450861 [Caerostris darwini]
MIMPLLYNQCLQKTFDCLIEEFWQGCPENPFEGMPSDIFNDLFRLLKPPSPAVISRELDKVYKKNHLPAPSFTELHLLFSSGQLTHLDLSLRNNCFCDWYDVKSKELIALMSTEACKNIRFLTFPFENHRGMIPKLLRRCPKLEYLTVSSICVISSDLCIIFSDSDEDCFSTFLALLRDIGYQLRHLSISASDEIPLNAMCERCPNLQSLEIFGTETVETCQSLKHLRSVSIFEIDEECLLFLLQNCVCLENLQIYE